MITITPFGIAYQIYIIPTIKITHNKFLNGAYAIELIWLKWGIEVAIPIIR